MSLPCLFPNPVRTWLVRLFDKKAILVEPLERLNDDACKVCLDEFDFMVASDHSAVNSNLNTPVASHDSKHCVV